VKCLSVAIQFKVSDVTLLSFVVNVGFDHFSVN